MGLQPRQLNGIGKSKWRTQFDYAGLQHQTQDKYSGNTRFNCQTQKMEVAQKTKVLLYLKRSYFKLKNDISENKLLLQLEKKCALL